MVRAAAPHKPFLLCINVNMPECEAFALHNTWITIVLNNPRILRTYVLPRLSVVCSTDFTVGEP